MSEGNGEGLLVVGLDEGVSDGNAVGLLDGIAVGLLDGLADGVCPTTTTFIK